MKKILCYNAMCRLASTFFYLYACIVISSLIVLAISSVHSGVLLCCITSFIVMLSAEFFKKWI